MAADANHFSPAPVPTRCCLTFGVALPVPLLEPGPQRVPARRALRGGLALQGEQAAELRARRQAAAGQVGAELAQAAPRVLQALLPAGAQQVEGATLHGATIVHRDAFGSRI